MERHYPTILRQFMGEERDWSNEFVDQTTKDAAGICGTSQATSEAAKRPEPLNREERAAYSEQVRPIEEASLKSWAIQKQLWVAEKDFKKQYADSYIASGAEQKVYLKNNGKKVLKVNLGRYHGNWLEYFNRLLFHAFLFPATKYITVGFTEEKGVFGVITEQPFFTLQKGASREVIEPYLKNHSFERLKNEDYYNKRNSVKLEDLHDENVFLDKDGHLLFIDPVIYFETVDLKLSGDMMYHFPW